MSLLQRLLLLPLLSPLLAVLLLGALNPRPWVALRLLTWTSASLPLGAWISAAAAGGAGLSAAAALLALQSGASPLSERRRRAANGIGRQAEASGPRRPWRAWAETSTTDEAAIPRDRADWGVAAAAWAGPSRAAGEPAPTVAVPFRVIRRGEQQRDGVADQRVTAASWGAPRSPMPRTGSAAGSGTAPETAATSATEDDWTIGDAEDW